MAALNGSALTRAATGRSSNDPTRAVGDGLRGYFSIGYYRGLVEVYRATGHHPRLIRDLDVVVSQLEAATGCQGVWPPAARPSP